MKTLNIQAAKTHLSRLIEDVLSGEEVVIAKSGKPLIMLVPYQKPNGPRQLGTLKGQCQESPSCWNFDEEVADSFYTEDSLLKANIPAPAAGQQ